MKWLKNKLTNWLGIDALDSQVHDLESRVDVLEQQLKDATATALDVHFKSNTIVIVASKLKGGQVRIIDADFHDYVHMQDWVKWAIPKATFEIQDTPPGIPKFLR